VGRQCSDCSLYDFCWSFLPEDHVFILRGQKSVAFDLMERGILKMRDIPSDYGLSEKNIIQVESHRSKKAYIDREAIKDFLQNLKYPLYFLDFETIAPAIPVYDLSRPYEEIPFLYSLYIIEKEGAKPEQHAYLAPGDVDTRPEILKRLRELLGAVGSIMAYNAPYEIKCFKNAIRAYPEYEKWFEGTEGRFVDLLLPFKNLLYYSPLQAGSASMKDVLPALTGITYDGMEIGGGERARIEYMRITFEKDATEKDRAHIRSALTEYCDLDTRGMIEILEALREN